MIRLLAMLSALALGACDRNDEAPPPDADFVIDCSSVGSACLGGGLPENEGTGYQRTFCAKTEADAQAAGKEHCETNLVVELRCPDGATCGCRTTATQANACTAPATGAKRSDSYSP